MSDTTNRPRRARIAGLIGIGLLVAALPAVLTAQAGPAAAATGPSNGATFTIAAVGSGKHLDAFGASKVDGTKVIQWVANGRANQRWITRTGGPGAFTIVNENSGQCLTVGGASTTAGAPVVQSTCVPGAAQQNWTFTTTSAGVSTVRSVLSGQCLDVFGRSLLDGAVIDQWPCHGGANQQWLLNPVGGGTSTAPTTPASPTGPPSPTLSRVAVWGPSLNANGQAFNNQTIRQVVHTTAAGTAPQVKVSNRYGTAPVVIGAVDVAVQASGGTAVAGSHHMVRFDGSPAVTLGAGQERVSDSISMSVAADQNLLVSIYIANAATTSQRHPDARATSWISTPGNHAAEDGTGNYPTTIGSWFFLSGLSVVSPNATGTLVAFGDSITDGALSTSNANRRYPDYLARRLVAQPGGPKLSVVNAGIGGNRVLADGSGRSALNRFAQDALGQPNVRSVILLEGINDINGNASLSPQAVIDGYQKLINQAHAAGVAIYGGTLLPEAGYRSHTPAVESTRQAINTWIRTSGAFDGVVDFDQAVRDPADPTKMRAAYDSGDHIHPNDAGYQAMANAVDLAMLKA
ncbi:MAG TPA: RICIN domain-containing protein [Micromonosporaceae bacterium]|nr:RICIN domain-containing protein [Micromonosporaceae bacterium]